MEQKHEMMEILQIMMDDQAHEQFKLDIHEVEEL